MEFIKTVIDFILHIDRHLEAITSEYGTLTYIILFVIIFAETGLVVTPFLPGDSLLFAIGAIAALGTLNLYYLLILLIIAAVLGDTVNYWVGKFLQPRIFKGENIRFLNKDHLAKTQEFYDKYGGKTIIIGRFIPIVRTFAPFVAGIGTMEYKRFIVYNIVGGILWICIFLIAGYFFGNLPAVRKNFTYVIFGIIILSILPAVIEYFRAKKQA
jgi:membrane-associated protein